MRLNTFVCNHSYSHVTEGVDLQCHMELEFFVFVFFFFWTYVGCLLLVEKSKPRRISFSSFKVAMELLSTYCRFKLYLLN